MCNGSNMETDRVLHPCREYIADYPFLIDRPPQWLTDRKTFLPYLYRTDSPTRLALSYEPRGHTGQDNADGDYEFRTGKLERRDTKMQSNSSRKALMNPIQCSLHFCKTPVCGKVLSPTPTSLPNRKGWLVTALS